MNTNIKLYIGSDQADFNEPFNVMFSIGDIRNMGFGNCNKSFTLNLPLTRTNKKLLKFISQVDVKSEPSATGRLYIGEQLIISGTVSVQSISDYFAKVIIDSDDWINALKDLKMTALDLSAHDHALTHTNVENSWSAAYPAYRYPMIYFGGLQSGESGSTAKWYPTDFIPMVSIVTLINKILSPYTISSAWIATSFVKDLFILCREFVADDDFIKDKAFDMNVQTASDNQFSDTIDNGVTKDFTLTDGNIDLNEGTDEGSDYSGPNNWYVVPETGTYHFTFVARPTTTMPVGITINSQQLIIAIKKTTGVTTITLATQTTNYVAANIFLNTNYTISTGYVHLTAGDKVFATRYMTQNLTNTGVTKTITMNFAIDTTRLYTTWGNANKYPGLNKNISLEEMLPDMTQIDFLAAIRDIFNLRFWFDKMKRTIYIEPWDSFLSSTVVNLTSYVAFESINTEIISQNYNKTIRLKWKEDTSDLAYKDYLKLYSIGPGSKDITLTSIYTKKGEDIREHPFSSLITGYNHTIGDTSTAVPRILNSELVSPFMIFDRKVGFNTRIVEWKGLTAGFTWYYDTDTQSNYPKIQGLDFATLYTTYWMKFFHYIDKGKILTAKIKTSPTFLMQFFTVIAVAANEGFRPTYKITIKDIDNYFFLQKVISDGFKTELELPLKQ